MIIDPLSFLLISLVVLVAVAVGAGIAAIMRHLEQHAKHWDRREEEAVLVRASPKQPRHMQQEVTYTAPPSYSVSGQQVVTGAIPPHTVSPADIPRPRSRADAQPTEEVPPVSQAFPVDVSFRNRASKDAAAVDEQRRGGN